MEIKNKNKGLHIMIRRSLIGLCTGLLITAATVSFSATTNSGKAGAHSSFASSKASTKHRLTKTNNTSTGRSRHVSKRAARGNPNKTVTKVFNVKQFDRINVRGPVNVQIIAGTPLHDVRIVGTENYVQNLFVTNHGRELNVILYKNPKDKGRAMAVIRAGDVRKIHLSGRGTAKAIGLNSPELDVYADYQGMIDLSGHEMGLRYFRASRPGMIRIRGMSTPALKLKTSENNHIKFGRVRRLGYLDYSGNGSFEMSPVKSHLLHIEGSGRATAELHGLVDVLELTLHRNAIFDGRHFKVNTVFAKTYGGSKAHLHVYGAQHAFASDSSDIMFYNEADFIASHMLSSGAVLNYARLNTVPEH